MDKHIYDVIVVGGGPSGMMAAGRAGACGAKVLLIEKNNRLGKKLSITGGRRCNITNAEFDTEAFLENFRETKDELRISLAHFGVQDTFTFFENRGLPLKVEARKRAFPESEKAQDVCDLLSAYVHNSGNVTVQLNTAAKSLVVADGELRAVETSMGTYYGSKVVIATGGLAAPDTGSTGEGLSMLASIGHTVKDPDPSLVPLKSPATWVHTLSGTTVEDIVLRFVQHNSVHHEVPGRVLFTHFGISGPTVINAAYIAKELAKQGPLTASIDLFPTRTVKELDVFLRRQFERNPKKLVKGIVRELLQKKIADAVLETMETDISDLKVSSVSKVNRLLLAKTLKNLAVPITGTMGYNWAIIADGGVVPAEVDFSTMQSRLYPNLYLIGDTLNINRPSGGFSLQLCWTMGWITGTHTTKP